MAFYEDVDIMSEETHRAVVCSFGEVVSRSVVVLYDTASLGMTRCDIVARCIVSERFWGWDLIHMFATAWC